MKNTETLIEAGTGTEDFPFQVNTLTTKLESRSPRDPGNSEVWYTNKTTPTRELQTGLSWNLALWIFTHNLRLGFKFLEKKAMSFNYQGVYCPSLVKRRALTLFLALACLLNFLCLFRWSKGCCVDEWCTCSVQCLYCTIFECCLFWLSQMDGLLPCACTA